MMNRSLIQLRRRTYAAALSAVTLASACASQTSSGASAPSLYQAQREVERYIDSGRYEQDFAQVVVEAGKWLEQRAPAVPKPAIVLDMAS